MLLLISIQFLFSIYRVFAWIIEVSRQNINTAAQFFAEATLDVPIDALAQISDNGELIREKRIKATRINRIALLLMFLFSLFFAGWITFKKPELILYYRAEIQLRTFLQPLAAYETFKHLTERYPDYRFIDSVKYRMAWILDRRLNQFDRAKSGYESFLSSFGYNNVWSDEALASLVRISFDKLNRPLEALRWSEEYLKRFQHGPMAPHMYLYRYRALKKENRPDKANEELLKAKKLYLGQKIQIINIEDRVIDLVDFSDAVLAE